MRFDGIVDVTSGEKVKFGLGVTCGLREYLLCCHNSRGQSLRELLTHFNSTEKQREAPKDLRTSLVY